ncbi:hypothetical protein Micbo1qcDRAFT_222394 [Microdochium bolleyi]|uniref:Apple domain-containing protein n=1 Tax=Microdochium bolleyi TaxID=196109 RepID=A0A136J606_9PEZI|nr:hypothetical protein Micbo1qcDRAFT_222394 [Microdochium bolleyi]
MRLQGIALGLLATHGVTAYEVDLSGNQASYSCPADNKKTYTVTPSGRRPIIYELRCSAGTRATHLRTDTAVTLKDCADTCAREPQCYSCDYDQAASACHLKSVPGENVAWYGDTWYPQECPKVRATSANATPKQTTDIACPFSDGKIYKAADGTWFYSQCCTDTSASRLLAVVAAKDHADCVELCAKNAECKSALFADNGGLQPENCKLYAQTGFSTTYVEGGHFAYVTDPPTEDPVLSEAKLCSTECPYADGQLYVSVTGEHYQMFCKKRHGTDYLKIDRRATFETCLAACAVTPGCDSVDYEARTKKCFYSNNQIAPAINAPAFVSAYSLGCAGSCGSCKNTTNCDISKQKALPDKEEPVSCKNDDGALVTLELKEWRVQCRHCFHSHGSWSLPGSTLEQCARHCARDGRCVGVNLIKDSCVMHPASAAFPETGRVSNVEFAKNAHCDSLAPVEREHADMALTVLDNAKTEREW